MYQLIVEHFLLLSYATKPTEQETEEEEIRWRIERLRETLACLEDGTPVGIHIDLL